MDFKSLLFKNNNLFATYLYITVIVCVYWTVSIITVFVNKVLLSSDSINLNAPLFVTWYQCLLPAVLCSLLSQFSTLFPTIIKLPKPEVFNERTVKKVLPVSILFTLMLALNNLCLKYVDVSFYYIGRSLTTIFNVIFSFILLRQKTSSPCLLCCFVIIIGFLLGVDQEKLSGSFSLMGTIYGVLSSLSLSLFSIYTKKVLTYINNDIWLLSYYNNVYSTILLIPFIIFTDEFTTVVNYDHHFTLYYNLVMFIGASFGFLNGFVSALQIKATSPLTHNVSGTAKSCAQTVIATFWNNTTRSALWWLSNIVVLLASATYARFKQLEMKMNHKETLITK